MTSSAPAACNWIRAATTGAVILFDNVSATGPIVVAFRNNDGSGGQYLANGKTIDIGEIRVSESIDIPVKRTPRISWANAAKQRFTSNGQLMPIPQPQTRTLQFKVAPLAQREAINNGTDDLMTVIRKMMRGDVSIYVPFPTFDEALYGPDNFASSESQEFALRHQCRRASAKCQI